MDSTKQTQPRGHELFAQQSEITERIARLVNLDRKTEKYEQILHNKKIRRYSGCDEPKDLRHGQMILLVSFASRRTARANAGQAELFSNWWVHWGYMLGYGPWRGAGAAKLLQQGVDYWEEQAAGLERLSKPSEAGCTGKLYSVGNCAKAGAWRANFSPRNCGSELNR